MTSNRIANLDENPTMRLLVINPNTSEFVTQAVVREAQRIARKDTEIISVTGQRGVPIISGRAENAIGAMESLELAAEHAGNCDAVLLAVSFDSGLKPLRQLLSVPVLGMSESAMLMAYTLGSRFTMLTFGEQAISLYEELAFEYGLADRLAKVRSLPPLTDDELRDPKLALPRLVEEIQQSVKDDQCEVALLSGAVFAGISEHVAESVTVPVVDGISAGVCMAESLVRLNFKKPTSGSYQLPTRKNLQGRSAALSKLFDNLP